MMKLIEWFLELLYPTRCAFCHKLTKGRQEPICGACREQIPKVPDWAQEQSFDHLTKCLSPLYYRGDVRKSLLRYKFHHLTGYADIYADFMVKCLDGNGFSCDSITWVPLSRKRLRKRGYDQARLLAEAIAAHYGLDCVQMLRKSRDNPPQSGTGDRKKRQANVSGVYAVCDRERVRAKSVLLVDDIVTTGSTLSECAKMLKQAGAVSVTAVTVARRQD